MSDFGSLVVFRDLEVTGRQEALLQLGDALEGQLPRQVWTRSREKEQQWLRSGGDPLPMFFFSRAGDDEHKSAVVSLKVWSDRATVPNIIPTDRRDLTTNEYNAVFADFVANGVEPVAARLQLKVQSTPAIRPMTDWLSEEAAGKLKKFSVCANKSTGSSHPLDRERWLAFICQAHRDQCSLDATILGRWLMEIEAWPEEQAHKLCIQYEFGIDLLEAFVAGA